MEREDNLDIQSDLAAPDQSISCSIWDVASLQGGLPRVPIYRGRADSQETQVKSPIRNLGLGPVHKLKNESSGPAYLKL